MSVDKFVTGSGVNALTAHAQTLFRSVYSYIKHVERVHNEMTIELDNKALRCTNTTVAHIKNNKVG